MKQIIKNASDRFEQAAAVAAIKSHQDKFGDRNKNHQTLYSVKCGNKVHQVEVTNCSKSIVAEVRKGHRRLSHVSG